MLFYLDIFITFTYVRFVGIPFNEGIPFNDNVDKVTFQAHWDLQWLDLILRDESMSSLWGFMGRTTSPDLPQGTSATQAEVRGAD